MLISHLLTVKMPLTSCKTVSLARDVPTRSSTTRSCSGKSVGLCQLLSCISALAKLVQILFPIRLPWTVFVKVSWHSQHTALTEMLPITWDTLSKYFQGRYFASTTWVMSKVSPKVAATVISRINQIDCFDSHFLFISFAVICLFWQQVTCLYTFQRQIQREMQTKRSAKQPCAEAKGVRVTGHTKMSYMS